MGNNTILNVFQEIVVDKYQIYSSLFLTLPFENVRRVGGKLPFFTEYCQNELMRGYSPKKIIENFFDFIMCENNLANQMLFLFVILQFVERQVVLLDAVEDAAFMNIHSSLQEGTLAHLMSRITTSHKLKDAYQLLQQYRIRMVLTAHPTQFYPSEVLEIISDLSPAIKINDIKRIRELLLQLGHTSFKNTHQPTPLNEADILSNYLERIFYPVLKQLQYQLNLIFADIMPRDVNLPTVFELGFWPGGDRDGNPNINPEITRQVANKLKTQIIDLYIREIDHLKQYLTFPNLWQHLEAIKTRLRTTQKLLVVPSSAIQKIESPADYFNDGIGYLDCTMFISELKQLKKIIDEKYDGLFGEEIEQVIVAALTFKFYFASIDLRQNSQIHTFVLQQIFHQLNTSNSTLNEALKHYATTNKREKAALLVDLLQAEVVDWQQNTDFNEPLLLDVIGSLRLAKAIQLANGELGLHRYIISNTRASYNILEILVLARIAGWSLTRLTLDIVPLFETITDLKQAKSIMQELYQTPIYRDHIQRRSNRQYIMLGYSDSGKDGGYFAANWTILKCKQELLALAKAYAIEVIFFDGRGGSPARGGGTIEKFYHASEEMFQQVQIQTTIQGQTISSNFGTKETARFNLEQLFTQVLSVRLYNKKTFEFTQDELAVLESLAKISYDAYQDLKHDSEFLPYLEEMTPLKYFGELNITSRPPSRAGANSSLDFENLRAIPFVGSWAQLKQNIPGYYGLGTALAELVSQGKEKTLKVLYRRSLYFRTLLENAMQSLLKSNFLLTSYMESNKKFKTIWNKLFNETELCISMLKLISERDELLAEYPIILNSIRMRENLVLPLLVIQQYAMMELYENGKDRKTLDINTVKILKNIILKSIAANVNASRNST